LHDTVNCRDKVASYSLIRPIIESENIIKGLEKDGKDGDIHQLKRWGHPSTEQIKMADKDGDIHQLRKKMGTSIN
jgi:hypothetical protein